MYPNSKNCTWNIEAPSGSRVELTFESFDLEKEATCKYDWLQAYEGKSSGHMPRIKNTGKLCGSHTPSNIVSRGNSLFLEWKADSSTVRKGFKVVISKKYQTKNNN